MNNSNVEIIRNFETIYIELLGPRHGVRMGDCSSVTHAELMEAEKRGLWLCPFVSGETSGEMDRAERDLIDSALNLYTTSSWTDLDDLRRRVEQPPRRVALPRTQPGARPRPHLPVPWPERKPTSSRSRRLRTVLGLKGPKVLEYLSDTADEFDLRYRIGMSKDAIYRSAAPTRPAMSALPDTNWL